MTLARQHHLTHLLPHIFSHPIVPVHSRPRTRGPPKSTFLFPTLLPPTHPLPNKEYHDTTKTASSSTPPEPPKKTSKSLSADKEEPPAHQTECIARITLSIGPISYPGTELWVGQFVEPRMAPPIKDKINKVVRQLPHDTAAGRRAALSNTPRASPIPRESTAPRSSLLPSPRGHLVRHYQWYNFAIADIAKAADFDTTRQCGRHTTPLAVRDHPQSSAQQCK